MTTVAAPRNWYKILGVFCFNFLMIWFILKLFVPDLRIRLATIELVGLFLSPLIIFYLRNNWSPVKWIINIIVISILVILSYSFIHESSHVIGVYIIGSKPIEVHLIPDFWKGEYTTAWVRSEPVDGWLGIIPGLSPYIKDIICLVLGLLIFRKIKINNSFLAGLIYAFFCLVPLFDIVNNYFIKLIIGKVEGNDFYGITLGWGETWAKIIGSCFSVIAIVISIWILIFNKDLPNRQLSDKNNAT
jgi:hypothetical protein